MNSRTNLQARTISLDDVAPVDIRGWNNLHRAQFPKGNAFMSSTFALAAARAWPHVRACYIDDDDGLAAIIPFQYARPGGFWFRAAERIAEELSDYFGMLARPGFTTTPGALLALSGCNYFSFSHLSEEQKMFGLTGEEARIGLRIELPQGGAAYWTALEGANKKFTSDTDRRIRKAEQQFGGLRFNIQNVEKEALLRQLLAYKRAQYLRTGKEDLLARPERMAFLTNLVQANADDCQSYLSTLYFGDTWAAMHFGLRSGKTLHYWFPVYNPELNSFAPGRLLLREIIRHAAAEGIEVIDRGEGETAAKRDFPSEERIYYSDAWHRNNPLAWMYRAQQSVRWRMSAKKA